MLFWHTLVICFGMAYKGKITKEPFVFRKRETGGKTCFAAQKHFFTPNALAYFPKKQYLCTRSGLVGVHIY